LLLLLLLLLPDLKSVVVVVVVVLLLLPLMPLISFSFAATQLTMTPATPSLLTDTVDLPCYCVRCIAMGLILSAEEFNPSKHLPAVSGYTKRSRTGWREKWWFPSVKRRTEATTLFRLSGIAHLDLHLSCDPSSLVFRGWLVGWCLCY
jgi:hypothetical protein